jgi:tetratricopeptide (TPR) repeat protein
MAKIGRNDPCPCESGKKYKKCCLPLHEKSKREQYGNTAPSIGPFVDAFDELDKLSNSVLDLIKEGRLDEAENVCHELMTRYPDQIDGLDRLAHLYEARGDNKKAAEYHRKAATFARSNPGFDQEAIEWHLSKARQLESAE